MPDISKYNYQDRQPITDHQRTQVNGLLDKVKVVAGIKQAENVNVNVNFPYQNAHDNVPHRVENHPTVNPPVTIDLADRSINVLSRGNETHTHIHEAPKSAEEIKAQKEKEENNNRVQMVVVGTLLAAISAFFVGKFMAESNQIEREIKDLDAANKKWIDIKFSVSNITSQVIEKIDDSVSRAEEMLTRKKSNHQYKLIYVASLVVSAVLGIAGGLAGATNLALAGVALAITGSIIMIGRWSFQYYDKQDQQDINFIHKTLMGITI